MIGMSFWHKFNPNPVNARVEDCAQRAISAALNVDWDTASDLIYEMAKAMGTTTHDDAAWGAVLRRAGFMRAVIPNTCPDCFTIADFCRKYPYGVYIAKTPGHVVCIVDGQAWDTWDSTGETVSYFWYYPEEA